MWGSRHLRQVLQEATTSTASKRNTPVAQDTLSVNCLTVPQHENVEKRLSFLLWDCLEPIAWNWLPESCLVSHNYLFEYFFFFFFFFFGGGFFFKRFGSKSGQGFSPVWFHCLGLSDIGNGRWQRHSEYFLALATLQHSSLHWSGLLWELQKKNKKKVVM